MYSRLSCDERLAHERVALRKGAEGQESLEADINILRQPLNSKVGQGRAELAQASERLTYLHADSTTMHRPT